MSLIKILSQNNEKPKFHPNCLYLKWTDSGPSCMPKYIATWVHTSTLTKEHLKWCHYVKWKELSMDILIASDQIPDKPFSIDVENEYNNKSYLKSHFQKVIRHSNVYKTLKTAIHFLDLDIYDFMRRLAIIAIEDSLPLHGYSTIVWFMAAISKDYKLNDSQLSWVLGYAHDICKCSYYEQIDHSLAIDKSIRSIKLFDLTQEGKNLVYSILFRRAYGGMKGDKEMCHSAGLLWSIRYHTKSRFLDLLERDIIFISPPVEPMIRSEWMTSAVDFHCYPGMIGNIWEKHDEFNEDDIRNTIWYCSSCITDKKNIATDMGQRDWSSEKYQKIWKVIKRDVQSIARFMINKQ